MLALALLALAAAPRAPAPAPAEVPLARLELAGGMPALVVSQASRPTTTLVLLLPDAVSSEPAGQEGGLALVAHALACQLERPGGPLHEVGGHVEVSVRWDALDLAVRVPGSELGPASLALAELLRVRALDAGCLRQARRALARAEAERVDAAPRARLRASLYPEQRRALGATGSATSREGLQPAQLTALWQQQLRGRALQLVVVGPVSTEQVAAALTPALAARVPGDARAAPVAPLPARSPSRIDRLEAPAGEPAELLLGLRLGAPDRGTEAARALLRDAWLEVGAPRSLAARGCQGLDDAEAPQLPAHVQELVLRCPALPADALPAILDQAAADLDRLRRAPLPAKVLRAIQERRAGQQLLALEAPAAQARALAALERDGGRAEALAQLPGELGTVSARALQTAAVALLAPQALRAVVRGPGTSADPQRTDPAP